MEYLKPKFTLPASTGKVSQDEWDRIFGAKVEVAQYADYLNYDPDGICQKCDSPSQ